MPAVSINKQNEPILLHKDAQMHVTQLKLQKLNELGDKVLFYTPYSSDLLTTSYHFFKHPHIFLQGKCFHDQQDIETVFQEFTESQSTDFYTTGINKHFSLAKMC